MTEVDQICQRVDPGDFSRLVRPGWLFGLSRLAWHLRTKGPAFIFNRAVRMAKHGLRNARSIRAKAGTPVECLSLQPGELVEVKSEREILETLDPEGQNRGLMFLPEMKAFCGRQFTVYKRLEKVFLEESHQLRSLKNTVLLSGVVCNGLGYGGCDRSCLYYWREIWLRRASVNGGEGASR